MPEIEKNYKQEFEKKQGEHATPVIVVTEPHLKRSNIDEIDEPGVTSAQPYEFNAQELKKVLIGSELISVDDSETQPGKVVVSLDQTVLDLDFIIPKNIEPTNIIHEVGDSNTIITTTAGVLDADHGYHIYLEIKSTGVHYGADFTVFPYNQSTCLTVFNMVVEDGGVSSVKECYASLNEQGQLVIDMPIVMTPESQTTIVHYKRII